MMAAAPYPYVGPPYPRRYLARPFPVSYAVPADRVVVRSGTPTTTTEVISTTVREKRQVFKTPLSDICGKRQLCAVGPETSVEEALRIMKNENITSLPVYSVSDDKSGPPTILGIVNLMDIVTFTVFGIAEGDPLLRVDLSNLDKLALPVANLIGTSAEGKSAWSRKSYNVEDLLEQVMYPFTVGVHRVLVYDRARKCDYLLSQTDVVRYLYTSPDVDSTVINATLESLGLATPRKVFHMDEQATTLLAYKKMSMEEMSSIAVVNLDGQLTANLSLSDLRGLDRASFPDLGEPITTYLRLKHGKDLQPPATVHGDQTLYEVMGLMLSLGVHRTWIVDDDDKPICQISMTDVIRQFAPKDFTFPTD